MKRAFICDTPFQLFNTLNFVLNNPSPKSDLYLVNQFDGAESILDNLRKENIFRCIYWVKYDVRESGDSNIKWSIKRMYAYLFPQKTVRRNICSEGKFCESYEEIYASTVTCFVACILKRNKKSKFIMIEDGTGSYSGNLIDFTVGWKHKLFSHVFHCGSNTVLPDELLVNNTKMCKSTMTSNIQSLPLLTQDTISIIEKIFELSGEVKTKNESSIIWLSQPNDGYLRRNVINQQIADILKRQEATITVRMHPRDKDTYIYDSFEFDKGNKMWELQIATADMDNKILIASHSSALFTPKILFDKEPILIFLFMLYDDEFMKKNQASIEQMITNLKNEYRSKDKVIIPRNYESLEKELLHAIELVKGMD